MGSNPMPLNLFRRGNEQRAPEISMIKPFSTPPDYSDRAFPAELAEVGYKFRERLRKDVDTLCRCRNRTRVDPASSSALTEILTCAHKLTGAAGIFGFTNVSAAAAALEESMVDGDTGDHAPGRIQTNLDALIACLESVTGNTLCSGNGASL